MLIVVDKKAPEKAKENLAAYGEILELQTENITYESISGHPDIFFCKNNNQLICAPNLPEKYFKILTDRNIDFIKGDKKLENKYPATAYYNALVNNDFLIHNLKITDKKIIDNCSDKKIISVKQGYCRCNLLPLKNNNFITSDKGIFKKLKSQGINVLFVSSDEVILPGFSHGFFPGACGVFDDKIFILGSLKYHKDSEIITSFVENLGYEIVELYDGRIFDGGSLLVLG